MLAFRLVYIATLANETSNYNGFVLSGMEQMSDIDTKIKF